MRWLYLTHYLPCNCFFIASSSAICASIEAIASFALLYSASGIHSIISLGWTWRYSQIRFNVSVLNTSFLLILDTTFVLIPVSLQSCVFVILRSLLYLYDNIFVIIFSTHLLRFCQDISVLLHVTNYCHSPPSPQICRISSNRTFVLTI